LSAVPENGIVSPQRPCDDESLKIDGRVSTPKTQNNPTTEAPPSEVLLRLQLESNPEALYLVRATVQGAAEIVHFQEHEARAIVRSVDEALANVIRHAYEGKAGMPIEVICKRLWRDKQAKEPQGMEIILVDSGIKVPVEKLKGRALDEIRPGGLGLHFIKQSMDVVEFSHTDDKNFLRLVKYLTPSKAAHPGEGQ
jgi:serine/threonine-protein kinase RsbW